jgi:hypothetical protein
MRKLAHVLLVGFGGDYDSLSGRLNLLNYRPVRAASLFEAGHACAEPGRSIRAALVPPQLSFQRAEMQALRERAGPALALIVVGPRPDAARLRAWKDVGATLALFEPFVDSELRFVLNEATHDSGEWSTRAAPRVPTPLMVRVHSATGQKSAILYNLSTSGAYLETPRPTASGGHIGIELPLPGRTLKLDAVVVSSNVPGNLQRPNLPVGMGVRFLDPGPEEAAALGAYVEERRRAYRL